MLLYLLYLSDLFYYFQDLRNQYSYVRKIRGDGNCFYRAFCFAYLESIHKNDRILQRSALNISSTT